MNLAFIGDLTVDYYPDQQKMLLGGSSLNSALWAKRQGAHASIVAAVGSDGLGASYKHKLSEEDIDPTCISVLPGKTSSITITLTETGERQFSGWDPGVLADFHLGDKEKTFLLGQHVSSLTLYGPTQHLLPEYLSLRQGKNTYQGLMAVDFGDFSQFDGNVGLIQTATSVVDIVFLGLDAYTQGELIAQLQDIAKASRATIVVTLAAEGSLAMQKDSIIKQKAQSVSVVDATGAGDAYIAGFLVEYAKSNNLKEAMKQGTQLATKVIQQLGA